MNKKELIKHIEENPNFKFNRVTLFDLKIMKNIFTCKYMLQYNNDSIIIPIYINFPKYCNLENSKISLKLLAMSVHVQLLNIGLFTKNECLTNWESLSKGHLFKLNSLDHSFLLDLDFQMRTTFTNKFKEFKDINLEGYEKFPLLDPIKYKLNKEDKYAISMSGGKESTMTFTTLQKLNYRTYPLFIDDNRFDPSEMMYKAIPWSDKIQTNIFEIFDFIAPKWGKNNLYLPILAFIELAYCNINGIRNLVFGNEFDCTVPFEFKGHEILGHNFDQSTHFERKISHYLKEIGTNMQVFSLVYNLSESAIQKIFIRNDIFNLYQYQMSCFTPKKSKNGMWLPCDECDKCQRIAFMLEGLKEDPERIGLSSHREILNTDDLDAIFNSEDGKKEAETLAYVYSNKYQTLGRIDPVWHQEIFDIQIDDDHVIILPDDIFEFFENELYAIRKELK